MEVQKIYGYMRVSTKEQNEERQRTVLLEVGVPKQQIYMDKQSGKDFDRTEYQKLLQKLDSSSVLFVKSLDRRQMLVIWRKVRLLVRLGHVRSVWQTLTKSKS